MEEISFSESQIIWNYVFLIVVCLSIIANNILILIAILTQRRLQSNKNIIFLASLSISQLVGGLLSIPVNIVLVQDFQPGLRLKFARVVTTFCGASNQLHLILLALDRCIALVDSTKYASLKQGPTLIVTVFTWVLSILGSVLSIVQDFKNYSIFVVVLFFAIPFLIHATVYGAMFYSLSAMGSENHTTLLRKEIRVAKSFLFLTIAFTLLWLPYMITVILQDHCGSCNVPTSHQFLLVLYCQMLTLCFSSLVYYYGSSDFRLAFKTIWHEVQRPFLRTGDNNNANAITVTSQSPSNHDDRNSSKLHDVSTASETSRTNLALFFEDNNEHTLHKSPAVQLSPSGYNLNGSDVISKPARDEVEIVPYEQTRYLGEIVDDGDFVGEQGTEGMDEEQDKDMTLLGFDDIDIAPYDQFC